MRSWPGCRVSGGVRFKAGQHVELSFGLQLEAKLVLKRNPGVNSDSYTFFPSRSTHKCGSRLPITLEMSDFDEK